MKLSHYFEDLTKSYHTELEDMQLDSEGKNVLRVRLEQKRAQFKALMPMIEFAPEMVAVAFHGRVKFSNLHAMAQLAACEPDEFPDWSALRDVVSFDPIAATLVKVALAEPGGEQFIIITACLEYLHGKNDGRDANAGVDTSDPDEAGDDTDDLHEGTSQAGETGKREDGDHQDERDEDHLFDGDLDKSGADWMAEQGFDRKD